MFIFHRIRYLLKQRKHVVLIWMTDGAANNPEVREMLAIRLFVPLLAKETDETIRGIRAEESCSVAQSLGLSTDQLRFLAHPSGQIKDFFSEIVTSLVILFKELQPHAIYTVAFEHGEFEHDVCNVAVRFATVKIETGIKVYEWPVVNRYQGKMRFHLFIPSEGVEVHRTIFSRREEQERLRLFRKKFRSQWFAAWLEQVLNWFPSDYKCYGEPYRLMPSYNYVEPLSDTQVMYQPASLRFDDFREMVMKYLKA